MLLPAVALILAALVGLVAYLLFVISAFRVTVWWGLMVLFVPFGKFIFAFKFWDVVKTRFLVYLGSYAAIIGIFVVYHRDFQEASEGRSAAASSPLSALLGGGAKPAKAQPPHEVRDLAADEAPEPQRAVGTSAAPGGARSSGVDPLAAQKAALVQHSADLNALYQQLNAERPTLKPGSPAVTAFNAKALRYQEGVRALQAEQEQINALEHPAAGGTAAASKMAGPGGTDALAASRVNAEAYLAMGQLQAAANAGDYPQFAALLKKCLTDYRQTPSWPQIATFGKQTLQNATPQRLTAAVQQRGTTARAEMDATVKQVQAIVNQIPPVVAKPPGASSGTNGFHPGAIKPDFNTADLTQGREFYQYDYAQMDGKPGVFYRSADCEFNPQTKFFYTRRDVPKKRLTDAEMQRVTALYRVLGKDEKILSQLPQQLAAVGQTAEELNALNKQLLASYAAR